MYYPKHREFNGLVVGTDEEIDLPHDRYVYIHIGSRKQGERMMWAIEVFDQRGEETVKHKDKGVVKQTYGLSGRVAFCGAVLRAVVWARYHNVPLEEVVIYANHETMIWLKSDWDGPQEYIREYRRYMLHNAKGVFISEDWSDPRGDLQWMLEKEMKPPKTGGQGGEKEKIDSPWDAEVGDRLLRRINKYNGETAWYLYWRKPNYIKPFTTKEPCFPDNLWEGSWMRFV